MKLIETHAHLYHEQFADDRAEALHRAVAAGVETILMPNVDHASIDAMLELEAAYPNTCQAMMGLHPCYVKENYKKMTYGVTAARQLLELFVQVRILLGQLKLKEK